MGGSDMRAMFPGNEWERAAPSEVGLDAGALGRLGEWIGENADDQPFRVLVVRHGYLAAEWGQGLSVLEERSLASAAKSVYASVLGIAVAEGKIPSADARVIDYYPEMMDVPRDWGLRRGDMPFPRIATSRFAS